MKMTAQDLKRFGVIDRIIEEPIGGAQNDLEVVAESIKKEVVLAVKRLKKKDECELVLERYEKFRSMGEYES